MNGAYFLSKSKKQKKKKMSFTIVPELEIVWIMARATAGIRLEAGWLLAASTKTIE